MAKIDDPAEPTVLDVAKLLAALDITDANFTDTSDITITIVYQTDTTVLAEKNRKKTPSPITTTPPLLMTEAEKEAERKRKLKAEEDAAKAAEDADKAAKEKSEEEKAKKKKEEEEAAAERARIAAETAKAAVEEEKRKKEEAKKKKQEEEDAETDLVKKHAKALENRTDEMTEAKEAEVATRKSVVKRVADKKVRNDTQKRADDAILAGNDLLENTTPRADWTDGDLGLTAVEATVYWDLINKWQDEKKLSRKEILVLLRLLRKNKQPDTFVTDLIARMELELDLDLLPKADADAFRAELQKAETNRKAAEDARVAAANLVSADAKVEKERLKAEEDATKAEQEAKKKKKEEDDAKAAAETAEQERLAAEAERKKKQQEEADAAANATRSKAEQEAAEEEKRKKIEEASKKAWEEAQAAGRFQEEATRKKAEEDAKAQQIANERAAQSATTREDAENARILAAAPGSEDDLFGNILPSDDPAYVNGWNGLTSKEMRVYLYLYDKDRAARGHWLDKPSKLTYRETLVFLRLLRKLTWPNSDDTDKITKLTAELPSRPGEEVADVVNRNNILKNYMPPKVWRNLTQVEKNNYESLSSLQESTLTGNVLVEYARLLDKMDNLTGDEVTTLIRLYEAIAKEALPK